MENNIQKFLDDVQILKNKNFEVHQVSAGKNINCLPLTFKQQKEIISTVAEGTIGVLKFQKIINDILLENTTQTDLKIEDKIPIILKLRAESLGFDIKVDGKVGSIEENVKNSKKLKSPKEKSFTFGVEVLVATPSLKEENKIITYAIDVIKKDGDKDTGKNIGNIYTFEITKFIKSVKFGDNELLFSDLSVKDRIKVVESLPLTVNKEIVKYIEEFKEEEQEYLKVTIDGEDKIFDIDVSFFDN